MYCVYKRVEIIALNSYLLKVKTYISENGIDTDLIFIKSNILSFTTCLKKIYKLIVCYY